jgi:hypothetical protein
MYANQKNKILKMKETINKTLNFKTMKTIYRITLLPNHNILCQELAIAAARSNGLPGNKKITIRELEAIFKNECSKYPTANENMTFEPIGENLVHVDRKVGESYETALILEQVDILEIPTLQRHDEEPQGLNNDNHEYLLN